MSSSEQPDLSASLDEFERIIRAKQSLVRRDARAILLGLGLRLDEGLDIAADLERLARLSAKRRAEWEALLASELELACAEHIHSVDPRYLDLPNYDFEYTLDARERLRLRLIAYEALGHPVAPAWLERIEAADRLLESHRPRDPEKAAPIEPEIDAP